MAKRGFARRVLGLLRRRVVWVPLAALAVAFAGYVLYLDWLVTSRFDGRRWTLPAHVYARPLEIYAGMPLTADGLAAELKRLGYRKVATPDSPGTWSRAGGRIGLDHALQRQELVEPAVDVADRVDHRPRGHAARRGPRLPPAAAQG